MISRTTATVTPMATSRRRRTTMTMPAVAPPLRPLFAAMSACPPCDGGNTSAVVASIAEVSTFDEDDSLVVDDIVFVGSVSK